MKKIICRWCEAEFEEQPAKAGLYNECPKCLAERSIVPDPLFGLLDWQKERARREADERNLRGEERDKFLTKWRLQNKDMEQMLKWDPL
jgi:hypothetical protein